MNWISLSESLPCNDQKCWVVDNKEDVYLATFCKVPSGLFSTKWGFSNMLGRRWTIENVVKWQPLIIPSL